MSMAAAAAVRRHLLSLSHHRRQPPHLHLLRHLCSSSSAAAAPGPAADASNSDRTPRLRPPPPPPPSPSIPIVSYAVKPKPPPPETPTSPATDAADAAGEPVFTKEDIRYMKNDMTMSHTKKVAPLPEDKVAAVEGGGVMAEERSSIGFSGRVSRVVRVSQTPAVEVEEVPFPTLIQVDKKSREKAVIDLQDAIRRVKANAKRNFDETLEAHVNLAIDRRRSDLAVSGAVVLPHGTGKIVKVAVFAEGAAADEAKAAGADIVGGDELIEEIKTSGKINFDKCIATHSMMQRVTKIGRILRGLTPNAKKGTVTNNVSVAVQEAKQGLLDFRMKDSIVHVGLGKVSFKEEALQENVGAFVNALLLAKPVGLKKTSKYAGYVNSFHLCSTMGPGFAVSIQSLSRAADLYSKMHPK